MPTYSRTDTERKLSAAEDLYKTNRIPRYMTRADVKKTIAHLKYILKRMGTQDSVNIPDKEWNKFYNN